MDPARGGHFSGPAADRPRLRRGRGRRGRQRGHRARGGRGGGGRRRRRDPRPKQAGLSFEEAACLPTAYLTAYRMLFAKSGLEPGATVLVQGAGGGVATA